MRRTQEARRTSLRVRSLWHRAGCESGGGSSQADSKRLGPENWKSEGLDAAVRKKPNERTAEDVVLLSAWVESLPISASVRRIMDVDLFCWCLKLGKPYSTDEVVACQGDEAHNMCIVFQGDCSAYTVTDDEGLEYTGEGTGCISRASVLRQLAKRRNRDSAIKAHHTPALVASRFRPGAPKFTELLRAAQEAQLRRRWTTGHGKEIGGRGVGGSPDGRAADERGDGGEVGGLVGQVAEDEFGEEAERESYDRVASAVRVQAVARGKKDRRGVVLKHSAAAHLQANARGKLGRRRAQLTRVRETAGTAVRDSSVAYVNRKVHCQRTRRLAPYSCFGELALVGGRSKCAECIVAERPTEIVGVDARLYREMQSRDKRALILRRRALLAALPVFAERSTEELDTFAAALRTQIYSHGEVISSVDGELALVESGEAALTLVDGERKWAPPRRLLLLGPGSFHSPQSASEGLRGALGTPTEAAVLRAAGGTSCSVLWLNRRVINAILGSECLQAVATQADGTIVRLRSSLERGNAAIAAHSPAALRASLVAEQMQTGPRIEPGRILSPGCVVVTTSTHIHGPPSTQGSVDPHARTRESEHGQALPSDSRDAETAFGPRLAQANTPCKPPQTQRLAQPLVPPQMQTPQPGSPPGRPPMSPPPTALTRIGSSSISLGERSHGFGGIQGDVYVVDASSADDDAAGAAPGSEVGVALLRRIEMTSPSKAGQMGMRPGSAGSSSRANTRRGGGGGGGGGSGDGGGGGRLFSSSTPQSEGGEEKQHSPSLMAQGRSLLRHASTRAAEWRAAPELVSPSGQSMSGPKSGGTARGMPPNAVGHPAKAHRPAPTLARPSSAPAHVRQSASASCLQRPGSASSWSVSPSSRARSPPRSGSRPPFHVSASAARLQSLMAPNGGEAMADPTALPTGAFSEGTLRLDTSSYATAHRKAQYMLGLGHDLLESLTFSEGPTAIQLARPRSKAADEKLEQSRRARPKDALMREERWSTEWMRREERVAEQMRDHVMHVRAVAGVDSKAALAARRKAASKASR
jgi:hypothetical protein